MPRFLSIATDGSINCLLFLVLVVRVAVFAFASAFALALAFAFAGAFGGCFYFSYSYLALRDSALRTATTPLYPGEKRPGEKLY